MINIQHIDIYRLSVPLASPYHLSKLYGVLHNIDILLVKLTTVDGLTAYGETNPMNPFTMATVSGVVSTLQNDLAPRLIGKTFSSIAEIRAYLDDCVYGNLIAKAALDLAVYDLFGKYFNMPSAQLLGGAVHKELPLLWSVGSASPKEDIAIISEKVEEGYRTFMLKMGVQPIDKEVKRIENLRKHFGHDIAIIVDPNQGWTPQACFQFMHDCRDYWIDLLEQPIARSKINVLARMRHLGIMPISADESLFSIDDAKTLIAKDAVDVFSLKVTKNGGMFRTQAIGLLANHYNISCLMNSMIEQGVSQAASLQVAATLPNLLPIGHSYFSTLRFKTDLTNFHTYIKNGIVHLPSAPGLGITVDVDKVKHYCIEHIHVKAN
jgi:muconate cycloisomerase